MSFGPLRPVLLLALLVAAHAAPFSFDAAKVRRSSRSLLSNHGSAPPGSAPPALNGELKYLMSHADRSDCDCCTWSCDEGWFHNNGTCWQCSTPCMDSTGSRYKSYYSGWATAKTRAPHSTTGPPQYQSAACDHDSDRVCTECSYLAGGSNCSSGFFKFCNATHNTHCIACSTCASGKYVKEVCDPTDFKDTVCEDIDYCTGSHEDDNSVSSTKTFQTTAVVLGSPTSAGSNPVCQTCPEITCASGEYKDCGTEGATTTKNTTCTSCTVCESGKYAAEDCGTDQSGWSKGKCTTCTASSTCVASVSTYVNGHATGNPTYFDSNCTANENNDPTKKGFDSACVSCGSSGSAAHTAAGCGSWQRVTCGGTNGLACTNCTTSGSSCASGKYFDTSRCGVISGTNYGYQDNSCQDCSATCTASYTGSGTSKAAAGSPTYETTACSSSANRVCSACPTHSDMGCTSSQYVVCSANKNDGTAVTNSTCDTCSSCTAGSTYETTACSGFQDRKCTSCSTCDNADGTGGADEKATNTPYKYRNATCTVTADTVCVTCVKQNCSSTQFTKCTDDVGEQCTACKTDDSTCSTGQYLDNTLCSGAASGGTVNTGFRDNQCKACTNKPQLVVPMSPTRAYDGYSPSQTSQTDSNGMYLWSWSDQFVYDTTVAGTQFEYTGKGGTSATGCAWRCKAGYYRMNDFCVMCPRNTTTAAAGATSAEECVPVSKPPGPKKGTDGNDAYCNAIPMGARPNIAQCRKHYQPGDASTCADCTVCASGEYPKTACTNTTNTVCEAIPTGHTIEISFGVTLSAYATVSAFDANKAAYHRGVLKAAQLPADTTISSTATLATSSRRLLAGVAVTTKIETAASNVGAASKITTNSLSDALATEGITGSISITTPPAVATVAPPPPPTTAAPTPAPTTTTAAPGLSGSASTRSSLLTMLFAALVGFLLRQ